MELFFVLFSVVEEKHDLHCIEIVAEISEPEIPQTSEL